MAHSKSGKSNRPIESYQHTGKDRLNNPPVGLVTPETDPDAGTQTYAYDPHLNPQLQLIPSSTLNTSTGFPLVAPPHWSYSPRLIHKSSPGPIDFSPASCIIPETTEH